MKGYDVFTWDDENMGYYNSANEVMEIIYHHLNDDIDIL